MMLTYFYSSGLFHQKKKWNSPMSKVQMFQVLVPWKVFSGMGVSIKQLLLQFLHIPQDRQCFLEEKEIFTMIWGRFIFFFWWVELGLFMFLGFFFFFFSIFFGLVFFFYSRECFLAYCVACALFVFYFLFKAWASSLFLWSMIS